MTQKVTPLLSIVVAVYNMEPLLYRCIDSVLAQEYSNWELILVNDGSTDGSLRVCQQYADRDPRIRVLSQENAGQYAACNRGIKRAKGEYICLLDSDDAIEPQVYKACIEMMEADELCDMVEFGYVEIRKTEQIGHDFDYGQVDSSEEIIETYLSNRMAWIMCNKVFRRKLFEGKDFKPGILMGDGWLLPQILVSCRRILSYSGGRYLYYQLEFTPDKYKWTERHEHDQAIVNGDVFLHFASLRPKFARARARFAYRVANQYMGAYRTNGKRAVAAEILRPAIRGMRCSDLLSPKVGDALSLKQKMKVLWAMIRVRIGR